MIDNEKYQKELIRMWDSVRDDNKGYPGCRGVKCKKCPLYDIKWDDIGCGYSIYAVKMINIVEKWSNEHQPKKYKVSKLEYDILKYISDNTIFIYIARDENGKNYIFEAKPRKLDDWWYGCGLSYMRIFDELFQFVQWEDKEPTEIKYILESCEVIKNEND